MNVDLIRLGAPALPEGYRYRVHVYEVHPNRVSVGVSIIKRYKKTIFNRFTLTRDKVVGHSTLDIVHDPGKKNPLEGVVREATYLYNEHIKDKQE
jgi:hypothetical protein